jgi:hypothetical protein
MRAAIVSAAAGGLLLVAAVIALYENGARRTAESPSAVAAPSTPAVPSAVAGPPPVTGPTTARAIPRSSDEAALMAQARAVQDSDPALALALARDGNARFPDGADAAERAEIVVMSLARLGKPSEARREAEAMVNKYPGTPWALEVERHTGAHPHRLP